MMDARCVLIHTVGQKDAIVFLFDALLARWEHISLSDVTSPSTAKWRHQLCVPALVHDSASSETSRSIITGEALAHVRSLIGICGSGGAPCILLFSFIDGPTLDNKLGEESLRPLRVCIHHTSKCTYSVTWPLHPACLPSKCPSRAQTSFRQLDPDTLSWTEKPVVRGVRDPPRVVSCRLTGS